MALTCSNLNFHYIVHHNYFCFTYYNYFCVHVIILIMNVFQYISEFIELESQYKN